ncbi:hemerythrin domain-containing protein [Paraburkholderia sp. BL10I2N1]|uniref:hemerythrin domain-containing protein n=1 Tax=Paraburkholderia sp. BL10I2N1 TaxID=1938796 RepID=UPI00105EEE5A|nr:hemerythrin domain-containing protein [Paraburkholderia sp. BL10I2N1]TDN69740.1 hemerythrin HHE cation binding domain-containing protein [Paraburkholderia sp. BL10I2N1]
MQQPVARRAIQTIIREHQQLSAVINGMMRFVDSLDTSAHAPGPMVMRAMLYYIREYPEKVHHPKEDKYLFMRLRLRTNELDDVIDELESQHVQGEARVQSLERGLMQYEVDGDSAIPELRKMVEEYAAFYGNHRRLEEEVVLPAALRCLTTAGWIELDEAFGANRDPFDSRELETDLDHLYSMIVNTMPDQVA